MEYKLITERSHLYSPNIHICFVVEFRTILDTEDLNTAVNKVFKKYPILRSSVRFDEDGKASYYIEEEVEPDFYEKKYTGEKGWISVVVEEQKKPFVLDRAPLIRFTCLKDEDNLQLIMCLHHILADGLSCVKILQDIMFFVQNPMQTVTTQPSKLLQELPLFKNERLSLTVKFFVGMLNKQWRKAPHIFSKEEYLTMREVYWGERSHTIEVAEIGFEKVSELRKKCHEKGVTVNTFLITLLLKCAQKSEKKNKKVGIAVSIRPEETSVGNFASAISIEYLYDTSKSIWENAVEVQKLAKKKLNTEKSKNFFLAFMKTIDVNLIDSMYFCLFGDFKNKAADKLRKTLGYMDPPFGLGLTNLGKVELSTIHGIKRAYFIPPLIPNTDKIVGVITTDYGLNIVYQYTNQFYTEKNKQIFEDWVSKLLNL
jgi:NRPS condensation-like uncharacterized protein